MKLNLNTYKTLIVVYLFLPRHKTLLYDNKQRLLSISVESSAMGAACNTSCLTANCHANTWTSFTNQTLQSTTTIASDKDITNKVGWQDLGKDDGIVMYVIHEISYSIIFRKTFNTWHPFTYAQNLAWWLDQIKPGRIITLAVHRSGTYGLGKALVFLASLGSFLSSYTPPHALWIWIFIKGGKTLLESTTSNPHTHKIPEAELYAHSIVANLQIHYSGIKSLENVFPDICNTNAAMKSVCTPVSQDSTYKMPHYHSLDTNDNTGIVVCAGGNVQHLAFTLTHLLDNRGITKSNILVAVGTRLNTSMPDTTVLSLLHYLKLDYRVIHVDPGSPSINHHLFKYYRGAWEAAITTFSSAKYIAFLDEDVEVSQDWLEFLLHAAPALDKDSSLWCISGTTSAHRNMHANPRILLRASLQLGWGYLLRKLDVQTAVSKWPNDSEISVLYDNFLYNVLAKGRECIYPALGRAKHYGVGVNTVPEIHQLYFLDFPIHDGQQVTLPYPKTLTWEAYEKKVTSRLSKAVPILSDPCAPGFFMSPESTHAKDYVFYFFLDSLTDAPEWTMLAECIGAWPYSTQGMHRGSVELPQIWGGSIWFIGVPYSPYSHFKPLNVPVWIPKFTDKFLDQQSSFVNSLYIHNDFNNRTFEAAISNLFQETKL